MSFVPLSEVNTTAAISSTLTIEQIRKNIKRDLPRLHRMHEFGKIKDKPIALVGGGPSLKTTLGKLKQFKTVVACGSVHDYLIEQNIIPTYAVVCDPDAIAANYMTKPQKNTKYLVASGCDDKVYNTLKYNNITMWHCHSDDYIKADLEPNFQAVGGGCTVGLRALSIALMFGYSDVHFFGFDSCLGVTDRAHHAYGFSDESETLGEIYEVCLGTKDTCNEDKVFHCAGYQLAQCAHFKDFYEKYYEVITPTFHGEGLLAELMDVINKERKRIAEVENTPLEVVNPRNKLKGLLETAATGQII